MQSSPMALVNQSNCGQNIDSKISIPDNKLCEWKNCRNVQSEDLGPALPLFNAETAWNSRRKKFQLQQTSDNEAVALTAWMRQLWSIDEYDSRKKYLDLYEHEDSLSLYSVQLDILQLEAPSLLEKFHCRRRNGGGTATQTSSRLYSRSIPQPMKVPWKRARRRHKVWPSHCTVSKAPSSYVRGSYVEPNVMRPEEDNTVHNWLVHRPAGTQFYELLPDRGTAQSNFKRSAYSVSCHFLNSGKVPWKQNWKRKWHFRRTIGDARSSFVRSRTRGFSVKDTTLLTTGERNASPAGCDPACETCLEQESQPFFRSPCCVVDDGRLDGSLNSSPQPEDAFCSQDGKNIGHSTPCEQVFYEDERNFLKDTGKDFFSSVDTKSATLQLLLQSDFLDLPDVANTPILVYTLHSSESVSEQDYVRTLMALPPEEREALMRSEAERLRTYGSGFWPIRDVMPPEELAAAGFYYTGVHDRVQCAFCRGVLRNWERGDSAMNEHRVHFSYCRLVMGLDCGNVPIGSGRAKSENASSVPSRGGQANLFSTTDRHHNDVPDSSSLQNLAVLGNGFQAAMGSTEPLPGVSTAKPKHPEHAVEARRLQSFSTWPLWALQSPENLAKAGFYYAGFGDNVKCFYCDGGLRNWEIMDNPWEEHARWFKECKYLLDVKGQSFVDDIQAKYAGGTQAPTLIVTPAAAISRTSPGSSLEHPSVQLVKSLGYSEEQILAALDRFYPQHQTGVMPKGAELLDSVLQMEDEASGALPAPSSAGRSLPVGRRAATSSGVPAVHIAVAPSRPSETASVPPQFTRQRNEPDGVSGPTNSAQSSRAVSDVTRQSAPAPSERPLAALHEIIFTGLLDIPDGEARYVEENRQMHKHLQCKRCQQRPAEVVLLPCGHFSSCLECVPSLQNCPVCSTAVRGTIRTYLC